MKAMNRVNIHGIQFYLIELLSADGLPQTSIRMTVDQVSKPGIIVSHSIDKISEAWEQWRYGEFIQNAFSFLSPSEREFIRIGVHSTEWDALHRELEESKDIEPIQLTLPLGEEGNE